MKVQIKDLGVLKEANFEVGNLTVICGENNTGKTYATYALYGFLDFWNIFEGMQLVNDESIYSLLKHGKLRINTDNINLDGRLKDVCTYVSNDLARVFGSREKYFTGASISVSQSDLYLRVINKTSTDKIYNRDIFTLQFVKESLSNNLLVVLKSIPLEVSEEYSHTLYYPVNRMITDALYENYFPIPYIASIERTGAAMFQKELDIRRNQLFERMNDAKNASTIELWLSANDVRYASPVRHNLDFIRDLENFTKINSEIVKNNPEIGDFFDKCAGGQYIVTMEGIYFIPHKSNIRLTMGESASSVRSLLNLGMFIKHIAKPGTLLMIDEPELNLHPKNQRMIARLLAKLVNAGVRVYITTHSDYIIREFNTLIMLKSKGAAVKRIMEKYGYTEDELLNMSDIKAYRARQERIYVEGRKSKKLCNVIAPATVGECGIEAAELDDTIYLMNEIQDSIIFSEVEYE